MRPLVSPIVAAIALLVGTIITVGYAALVGLPLGFPLGQPGSPSAEATTRPPGTPAASAQTAVPPPSASAASVSVMVGAGDIAVCDRFQDEATADAVERIAGTVFTLGDNVYPDGSVEAFRDCYGPTWGRPSIKSRTRPTAGGNEYKDLAAAPYFAYFGAAAGDPSTGYYAYAEGSWRVYVLNSNCTAVGGCAAGSPQERWLRSELARHPTPCVLAMWHHPLFSSGLETGSPLMKALWQALQDAGAELVLNGNHHGYERFAPQTAEGEADRQHGMVEIVAGTGGAQAAQFSTAADTSVIRSTGVYGVVRLELAPDSYRFEFLSTGGHDFSDSGSGRCH